MNETYLILDPATAYGAEFVSRIHSQYGIKATCVYSDAKLSFYARPHYPVLQSKAVAKSVVLKPEQLKDFAEDIQRRAKVRAIIPVTEPTIDVCAALSEQMKIEGPNSPAVLRRFRDKAEMKTFLWEHHDVRVPKVWPVKNAGEVLEHAREVRKYVLKPTRGYGNRSVGIFEADTSRSLVEAHLGEGPDEPWLMEEFIGGREYAVNGQVGSRGQVLVHSMVEYTRTEANGRRNVYENDIAVPQTEDLFSQMVRYSERVLTALNLRSSPFHLEVKIDEAGPCLIDLGARLVGNGVALAIEKLHPKNPKVIDLAIAGYLFQDDAGLCLPWDFEYYNKHPYARVSGISLKDEFIARLEGIEAVEKLEEFAGWAMKPFVGQQVKKTVDLTTMPWDLDLIGHKTKEDLLAVIEQVRQMIRWNAPGTSDLERATAKGWRMSQKAQRKAMWMLQRALPINLVKLAPAIPWD